MTPMSNETDRLQQAAFETTAIQRAVDALEAIAASLEVLATIAVANKPAEGVEAQAKRKPGRPRKYLAEQAPVAAAPTGTMTFDGVSKTVTGTDQGVNATAPLPAKPAPTEAERAEAFGKLKTALKECLSLHGEEVARQRLKFPKFSEVPYEAIPATIERLAA